MNRLVPSFGVLTLVLTATIPGANGKLPAVANTVDVANATWANSIGSPELIAV